MCLAAAVVGFQAFKGVVAPSVPGLAVELWGLAKGPGVASCFRCFSVASQVYWLVKKYWGVLLAFPLPTTSKTYENFLTIGVVCGEEYMLG
jgi:hypothetical protein